MPHSRLSACAALPLVVLSAAACGGPPGDTANARAAVETFLSACAEGEPLVVIESLTPPARRAFARGSGTADSCNEVLELGLPPAPPAEAAIPFEEARVTAVEASGGIARATVEVAGRRSEVEAELVGGRWLLNDPAAPTG